MKFLTRLTQFTPVCFSLVLMACQGNKGLQELEAVKAAPPAAEQAVSTALEDAPTEEAPRERLIPLEGGRNFRDIGGFETADGKSVAWGKIYRSGVLNGLTDADYEELAKLEISTVIDFSSSPERHHEPTDWRAGEIEALSWDYTFDFDVSGFKEMMSSPNLTVEKFDSMMIDVYGELLIQQKPAYTKMFAELVDDDKPLLYHCSAGKDRTGIATALILTVLGVDHNSIVADYEISEKYLQGMGARDMSKAFGGSDEELNDAASEAMRERQEIGLRTRGPYLEAVFAQMNKQSGSTLAYIQEELGVSDDDIALMKTYYLED